MGRDRPRPSAVRGDRRRSHFAQFRLPVLHVARRSRRPAAPICWTGATRATIAPFARVILETTGLADPAPILLALAADPRLAARFRVAGVTTLVDAVNGEATLAAHERSATAGGACRPHRPRQERSRRRRRALRPARRRARGAQRAQSGRADPRRRGGRARRRGIPGRAAGVAPARRRARRSPTPLRCAATSSSATTPIRPPALGRFLDLLSELLGPRLLRVKGLIGLADNPDRPLLIHGAQHVFHAPRVLSAWPDGERLSRLVVIADGVAPAKIEALWAALTGAPQIDAPDLDALPTIRWRPSAPDCWLKPGGGRRDGACQFGAGSTMNQVNAKNGIGSERRHVGATEERDRLCPRHPARAAAHAADRREPQSDARRLSRSLGQDLRRPAGAARRNRGAHLPPARRARQPLRALGPRAGARQGRRDLPDDGQPPGICRDLARHGARRRGDGADQHQSCRPLARPFARHRRRQGGDRRSAFPGAIRHRPRQARRAAARLRPWRGGERREARRSSGRRLLRRRARPGRAAGADDRGPGAVHLHLRHHRPAEGGAHHPLARFAHHVRLRRRRRRARRGPNVRLPADVSLQRRRHRRRSRADGRRLMLHSRAILGPRVLERRDPARLHDVHLCRRIVPLPLQHAAGRQRSRPSHPHGGRQRTEARHLRRVPGALRHSPRVGVLRRHRRQRRAVQFRFAPRRGRPAAGLGGEALPDPHRRLRRRRQRREARRRRPLPRMQRRRTRRAARRDPRRSRQAGGKIRRLLRPRRRRGRRSCATCSSPATRGFAPATC